jgi:peptide deformylase
VSAALEFQFLGSPLLSQPTRDVTLEELTYVRDELVPQMRALHDSAWTKGLGLAANQAGSNLRVAIVGLDNGKRWVTFINPVITKRSPYVVTKQKEGCLSVPNFRADVKRHVWVNVAWRDEKWIEHQQRFLGLDAQILQHEVDHLNGKSCIMDGLLKPDRKKAESEVRKFLAKRAGVPEPIEESR